MMMTIAKDIGWTHINFFLNEKKMTVCEKRRENTLVVVVLFLSFVRFYSLFKAKLSLMKKQPPRGYNLSIRFAYSFNVV